MNLADFYREAAIEPVPPWAGNVRLVHPYTKEEISPRDYQITGVHHAVNSDNQRFGLYDTMGSGKSLVSYLYIAWHAGMGNKVLAVMPPKLLKQYKDNFYAMLEGIPVWMEIYHGAPKIHLSLRDRWKLDAPAVVLTSPEMFRKDWEFFRSLGFLVLVQDEATWMSNPDNKISKCVEKFCEPLGSRASLAMTGTPARSCLTNLYGFIEHTSPGRYSGRAHFNRLHVQWATFRKPIQTKSGRSFTREIKKVNGYKNMDTLFDSLFLHGRRVEVPPPTETEILYKEVELGEEHYARYKKMVEERLLIFDDDTMLDLTTANSIRHICSRAVMDPSLIRLEGVSALLETVQEMVEEVVERDSKVIISAYYQDTVERLVAAFSNHKAVALYGKVAGAKAVQAKEKFLTDPACKVLVLNYESGGVGLDGLQNVCYTMIAAEPTSITGDFDQTVARLARSGQQEGVRVFNMIASGTIYKRIITDRLKRKTAIERVVKQADFVSKEDLRAELLGE